MNVISFKLSFSDEKEAELIYKTLLPDFKKGFPGINKASIKIEGKNIFVLFEANRLSKIRALSNTFMRWLISIEELNDILGV